MRVVIAEDLFLLRDGLTRLLQAHGPLERRDRTAPLHLGEGGQHHMVLPYMSWS